MWDIVKFAFFCLCIAVLTKTCTVVTDFDLNDIIDRLEEVKIELNKEEKKEHIPVKDTSKTDDELVMEAIDEIFELEDSLTEINYDKVDGDY